MRKCVLCGVLLLLFGKMVSAQQTLSLQECRDLAVKNNKELRIAEEKIRIADPKVAVADLSGNFSRIFNRLFQTVDIDIVISYALHFCKFHLFAILSWSA